MKVTVIIPNYNGKHFLEPCLESLSRQSCQNFKILIVDNASTDGSIEYLEENYDCIDGRISTQSKLTPGDDTESHPEFSPEPPRPSILTRLKEKQAEVQPPASKSDTHKRDAPTLD